MKRTGWICSICVGILLLGWAIVPLYGADALTSTSESLGLGESRFDSGYSPITLTRPDIQPGRPFNIKPTMDSFISGQGGASFGGLLNRYDVSGFGRIFSSRAAAAVANASISRALPTVDAGNVVNASDEPRMYPPRLKLDETEFPPTDLTAEVSKDRIDQAVRRVLDHHPLASNDSLQIHIIGDQITLDGTVSSQQIEEALVICLNMEPGVGSVVSRLEMHEPSAPRTYDALGYEQ